ncbi:MAG TPA: ABC transporter substrate-binding protein [Ktedonobacteraceae bacterium]|nr:ABC transporter substrate-binding protein [Ktedonobacteraceae bacterium]
MPIYDRQQQKSLDQLVEEYVTTNNINRRQFMQRAIAAGLSVSGASALLAACGGSTSPSSTPATVTSIDVLHEWSGNELTAFTTITNNFTKKTGIKVNGEATRDLLTVLSTRVRGNNPPDAAGMPNISLFQQLATQGKLLQLDSILGSVYQQDYAPVWQQFASVNGHYYAVLPKASTKGTIWYNPKQFQANGYTIPTTWDDLIALSNKIAGQGKYPWSMGVLSAGSSGWPGADWIDQIYINLNGPDMYDKWYKHQIPWTDPSIKNAWQMYGQIVNGPHYIKGAPQSILATAFQNASYLPYDTPPQAYMYYLGDFTSGFISAQFPSITAGTDYNFFPFPTINPQYAGADTGGADIFAAFKDNNGTRQFMQYMASAEAQTVWVQTQVGTSVNKAVSLSAYPNDVERKAAQQLTSASSFRFGADDLMPSAMENAYWAGVLNYIQHPSQLDSILSSLESTAMQSYTS